VLLKIGRQWRLSLQSYIFTVTVHISQQTHARDTRFNNVASYKSTTLLQNKINKSEFEFAKTCVVLLYSMIKDYIRQQREDIAVIGNQSRFERRIERNNPIIGA